MRLSWTIIKAGGFYSIYGKEVKFTILVNEHSGRNGYNNAGFIDKRTQMCFS